MPASFTELLNDLERLLQNQPAQTKEALEYWAALPYTKPETALTEKLWLPLMAQLNLKIDSQVKAGDGWVDYLLTSEGGNPVAIELKPLFKYSGGKTSKAFGLESDYRSLKSNAESGKRNQIQDYLREHDYVVLTNMHEYYAFNREALVKFDYFHKGRFADMVEEIHQTGEPWEVLRRIEDSTPRHGLDVQFYRDLQNWYKRLEDVVFTVPPAETAELKVLLLNKFIFAQTLEDYSLIPFRFLQDTYNEANRRWKAKGRGRVLKNFLEEVDEWFYDYYDTSLFKTGVLDSVAQDATNLERFQHALEDILGLTNWSQSFGLGLTHYTYRAIDEDVFGKTYETFLAKGRKEGGIYYTPREITTRMAKMMVDELLVPRAATIAKSLDALEFETAQAQTLELTQITFLDPSVGSGSFLIKLLREIYEVYKGLEQQTRWAVSVGDLHEPPNLALQRDQTRQIRKMLGFSTDRQSLEQSLFSRLMLRHLTGADLDERALDVARVNLWKEAVKLEPTVFRYKNLRDAAHVLPDLRLNLIQGDSLKSPVREQALEWLLPHQSQLARLMELRQQYLADPYEPDPVEQILAIKDQIRATLPEGFTLYELEFFWLYFDPQGNPTPQHGPHGIIGNPPWETVKPYAKEFAARYVQYFGEEFGKFSLDGPDFQKQFDKTLKQDAQFKTAFEDYQAERREYSEFMKERYPLIGSGDRALHKAFFARSLEIGRAAIALLIPSNFHTDEGAKEMRQAVLSRNLKVMIGFENRSGWFADVDSRFKFDLVFWRNDQPKDKDFMARFYVHTAEELSEPFVYPVETLEKFSPRALSFVEFSSLDDLKIAETIRAEHPLLYELSYEFRRELHMTENNDLFKPPKKGLLPLFEGKMIHQYQTNLAPEQYAVSEVAARQVLWNAQLDYPMYVYRGLAEQQKLGAAKRKTFLQEKYKEVEAKFTSGEWKLDYQLTRLAYRSVAASTNERTIISAVLPAQVFLGHSLNYLRPSQYLLEGDSVEQFVMSEAEVFYIQALLNSFVLDYYIRLRVSANVSIFYLEELPIPQPAEPLRAQLASLAQRLQNETLPPDQRRQIRAGLEASIACEVFGLSVEQMGRILETFKYGNIDLELKRQILEVF